MKPYFSRDGITIYNCDVLAVVGLTRTGDLCDYKRSRHTIESHLI